jgi:hypothetical protein
MYQNSVWKVLIVCMSLVTVWFTISSLYKVYSYLLLNEHTQVKIIAWSIQEINEIADDRYLLKGDYSFDADGKNYIGETVLQGIFFRNSGAAERAITEYNSRTWEVWYNSRNPAYSSLQKNFPIKECLSSLLLWGLLAYFIGLGRYAQKLSSKKGEPQK